NGRPLGDEVRHRQAARDGRVPPSRHRYHARRSSVTLTGEELIRASQRFYGPYANESRKREQSFRKFSRESIAANLSHHKNFEEANMKPRLFAFATILVLNLVLGATPFSMQAHAQSSIEDSPVWRVQLALTTANVDGGSTLGQQPL